MLYVSFVEILTKAVGAFEEQMPGNERLPYLYATLSFFGGVVVMWGLDALVAKLDGKHDRNPQKGMSSDGFAERQVHLNTSNVDIDEWVRKAAVEIHEEDPSGEGGCFVQKPAQEDGVERGLADLKNNEVKQRKGVTKAGRVELVELKDNEVNLSNDLTHHSDAPTDPHDKKLVRMGVNTALSIAIHNFPEGLATYEREHVRASRVWEPGCEEFYAGRGEGACADRPSTCATSPAVGGVRRAPATRFCRRMTHLLRARFARASPPERHPLLAVATAACWLSSLLAHC
jgi:zinc transporter ZupT